MENDIVVMEPKLKLAKALAPAQTIQSLRRNHISRLPVELLTDVFSYLLPETLAIDDVVEALETESDWCLHMRRKHGDIIHASHVCRSWRRICLSTPSFWSLIWVTDEDQFTPRTCEFVRRSGSVPLEVAIRDERSRDQRFHTLSGDEDDEVPFHGPLLHPLLRFFGQFPHSLQRMKTLRVCSRFPSQQDFTSYFKEPAPVLESFALYVDCLSNTGYEPIVLQLPIPLFDGTTPSLRKLSLDGAEVPWTSNIFNNLTFLRICRFESRREDDRVHLGQLLQIIKNCPGIVSLELRFAGPVLPADYDKSPKTSQYTAPYLKNIILSDPRSGPLWTTHT
ncbi:hypothetical protein SCHPADRAFT_248825 [Schizopora paradoxa]|uniref:Uncharacterized protein n=1 Tax=Schizopora paradoxa TaxID=27342 RepID=A0A0H2RV82_9AGAM|nr:hypothetical protein SCHPADRAFT_248825 [Schizopora paradoxa]